MLPLLSALVDVPKVLVGNYYGGKLSGSVEGKDGNALPVTLGDGPDIEVSLPVIWVSDPALKQKIDLALTPEGSGAYPDAFHRYVVLDLKTDAELADLVAGAQFTAENLAAVHGAAPASDPENA